MRKIDEALEQVKQDVENEDFTALEELFKLIPEELLNGYLSEDTEGNPHLFNPKRTT
jgi:hypothetical protein